MRNPIKRTVQFGTFVYLCWAIGNLIRGPFAEQDAVKDMEVGAAAILGASSVAWAFNQPENDDE